MVDCCTSGRAAALLTVGGSGIEGTGWGCESVAGVKAGGAQSRGGSLISTRIGRVESLVVSVGIGVTTGEPGPFQTKMAPPDGWLEFIWCWGTVSVGAIRRDSGESSRRRSSDWSVERPKSPSRRVFFFA